MFKKLATHKGIPCADQQMLEKRLTIIRAIRNWEYALDQLENKYSTDKICNNFDTYFYKEKLKLKTMKGLNMH